MVKVEDGGPSQDVPLVYYDKWGERVIVGTASVQLIHGQLQAVGRFNNIPGATEIEGLALEAFSVIPEFIVERNFDDRR